MDIKKPQNEQRYQHYVPQFYLKFFSNNGKSIGMFRLSERKLIENASIRSNAGREYFYGKDNSVEKWFSIQEGLWANIIRDIILLELIPNDPEKNILLRMCILLTEQRTAHTADILNDCITEMSRVSAKIMKAHGQLDVDDSLINDVKVKIEGHMIPFIKGLPELMMDIFDLRFVLIKNKTSLQFITSDRPVARYNQVFIKNNYFRNYGLGHVGIQLFFPISPTLCLCLFDSVPYNDLADDKGIITISSPDQINELNKLFLYNSDELIFYNNSEKSWKLEKLVVNKKKVEKENTYSMGTGDNYVIPMHHKSVHEKLNLQFFTVSDKFRNMSMPCHMAGPVRPHIKVDRKEG